MDQKTNASIKGKRNNSSGDNINFSQNGDILLQELTDSLLVSPVLAENTAEEIHESKGKTNVFKIT